MCAARVTQMEIEIARFDALCARFRERAILALNEVAALHHQAKLGSDSALQEMGRVAHGLHGTGGSFGFDELSRCARRMELLLKRHPAPVGAVREHLLDILGALTARLQNLLRGSGH
jgi:chemotaxis protein histidine kinase CheA